MSATLLRATTLVCYLFIFLNAAGAPARGTGGHRDASRSVQPVRRFSSSSSPCTIDNSSTTLDTSVSADAGPDSNHDGAHASSPGPTTTITNGSIFEYTAQAAVTSRKLMQSSFFTAQAVEVPPIRIQRAPWSQAMMASSITAQAVLPGDIRNISTSVLKLGFDVKAGAALAYLTCLTADCVKRMGANKNYISTWDAGRYMQQSYYGNADNSKWDGRPWVYNPVQGGSWHTGDLNLTLAKRQGYRSVVQTPWNLTTTPMRFSSTTYPRHWALGTDLRAQVNMSQTASFIRQANQTVAKLEFTVIYKGSAAHAPRSQEVPALFLDRAFTRIACQNKAPPWRNQAPYIFKPAQLQRTGGHYGPYAMAEPWAAYLLEKEDWGVGIFFPHATQFVAYNFVGGHPQKLDATSYIAPVVQFALAPGPNRTALTYKYSVYLTVGTLAQIRAVANAIRNTRP